MNTAVANTFPKLHNAMWPGLVGKGGSGAEPCIDLDTMLDLTARAEVNGAKFDGVDLFLYDPHVPIDINDDGIRKLSTRSAQRDLSSDPWWRRSGSTGSAMGDEDARKNLLEAVRKACRIAKSLRELGSRPYGIVRIDSACRRRPIGIRIRRATRNRSRHLQRGGKDRQGPRRTAGGRRRDLLGRHAFLEVHDPDRSKRSVCRSTLGFQADMAHTLLYLLGCNAAEHRIVPEKFHWEPDNSTRR